MKILEVYTDGSARPNPGDGSWAFCIVDKNKPLHFESGFIPDSTCNQMEMRAVINSLEYIINNGYDDCMIYLHTDSQYVQLGITNWIVKWKQNNFKSANGTVKNIAMWKQLDKLSNKLTVHFQWVRGHSGNKWNEFVDKLCSETLDKKT